MTKKFVIIAVAAISLTTFAVNGVAQAKNNGERNRPQLTETQKTELKTMRNEFEEEVDPLAVELASKRAELRAVLNGENPNSKEASRVAGELEKLEQDMRDMERAFREEISEKFDLPLAMHQRKGRGMGGHGNYDHNYYHNDSCGGRHNQGGRQ